MDKGEVNLHYVKATFWMHTLQIRQRKFCGIYFSFLSWIVLVALMFSSAELKVLLFGSNSFDTNANANVLNATIECILSTKRSDELLFQWKQEIFKQSYEAVNSVFIAVVICIIYKFLFLFSSDSVYSRVPLQF